MARRWCFREKKVGAAELLPLDAPLSATLDASTALGLLLKQPSPPPLPDLHEINRPSSLPNKATASFFAPGVPQATQAVGGPHPAPYLPGVDCWCFWSDFRWSADLRQDL